MADWSNPLLTSTYTNFLTEVKARDTDVALQFNNAGTLGGGASNVPAGAIGWDATAKRWKTFSSGSWNNELADYYNLTAVGVTSATVPPNGIYLPATNTVGISTGGTGKVYVTSGGNVGIGTANPSNLLELGGQTSPKISINSSGTGVPGVLFQGSSNTYGSINQNIQTGELAIKAGSSGQSAYFITFGTNDGTERARITSTGDVNIKGAGTAGSTQAVSFSGSAPINSLVMDSSGRLLVGTSTARTNIFNTVAAKLFQVESDTGTAGASFIRNSNDGGSVDLVLGKSRSASVGGNTVVQSGDSIGSISFQGNDGSEFVPAASITAEVDGTPGANDMPGRLVFSTTADGASSPTARVTINNLGYLTGTVNGLSSGIYPAQQYYRLNADYTGSNVNTAQSLFGVGVTLIGSTQYEFECLMILQAATITTATTVSFDFGGTATVNNIAFMGTGPGITGKPAFGGYDGTPTSFYYTSATGGDITATNAAGVSAVIDLVYLIKGTVSINAGGTFIPRYKFSSAPGNAWVTARGSYFSIWPLGASGSNISIGSWA